MTADDVARAAGCVLIGSEQMGLLALRDFETGEELELSRFFCRVWMPIDLAKEMPRQAEA
jgi:hypothetical protein